MSIERLNKKYQLNWLLDMINEKNKNLNYQLLYLRWYKYEIINMNDNWKVVKRWTLDFLIWFCEWFLYVK